MLLSRALILGVLGTLLALPAAAEEGERSGFISELKIGVQAHDVPYGWSGFNKEPITPDLNLEVQFSTLAFFWGGRLFPALGTTINFDGHTSKAYLDARWLKDYENHTFFAMGIGIAVHNGETLQGSPDFKQLGRSWLFHPSFEFGYRFDPHQSVSIFFEHISNADTAPRNQGLDTLGIRYGYRF
jgi:lipid A 3-O-deacylase